MTRARTEPLAHGDRVTARRLGSPLDGLTGRVVGLAVRSCDGRVGVAVQYSARAYVVFDRRELRKAGEGAKA